MIIDCISDLHGHYPELEGGDLLIVAGDLTASDIKEEYLLFGDWIQKQKYKFRVVICGNHDGQIEKIHNDSKFPDDLLLPKQFINPFSLFGCQYLCDSGTEFEYNTYCNFCGDGKCVRSPICRSETKKLKIWGSPWTKRFPGMNPKAKAMAFTVDTEKELFEKWKTIPDNIDILITHSAPHGVLDEVKNYTSGKIENVGSNALCHHMQRCQPRLHVFGHIHEGYGIEKRLLPSCTGTFRATLVNASHVNELYKPVNKPIRIIL